ISWQRWKTARAPRLSTFWIFDCRFAINFKGALGGREAIAKSQIKNLKSKIDVKDHRSDGRAGCRQRHAGALAARAARFAADFDRRHFARARARSGSPGPGNSRCPGFG